MKNLASGTNEISELVGGIVTRLQLARVDSQSSERCPQPEAHDAPATSAPVRGVGRNAAVVNAQPVHPVTQLRQGWIELLSRWHWSWFCTFTFDPAKVTSPNGSVHPEKAEKSFRYFTHELNCELYGRNWKRRGEGVYSVLALERHKSGVLHMHALIGAERDLNDIALRVQWKEWWYQQFGIARIEQPQDAGDVAGYCSKYVVKGGDLILSETLRPSALQLGLGLRGSRTK